MRTKLREQSREREDPPVLVCISRSGPERVVSILFAPPRITPGRLDVSIRVRANPNLSPSGWNRERANPRQDTSVAKGATARVHVPKASSLTQSSDAGRPVIDIAKPGGARGRPSLSAKSNNVRFTALNHAQSTRFDSCTSLHDFRIAQATCQPSYLSEANREALGRSKQPQVMRPCSS
jgi:hypothetical protein